MKTADFGEQAGIASIYGEKGETLRVKQAGWHSTATRFPIHFDGVFIDLKRIGPTFDIKTW